jgi:hypothetical protein
MNLKFIRLLFFIFFSLNLNSANSQGTNYEYDKIQIGDVKNLLVWLDLHPDNKTLAVTSHQSFPLYMYNLENNQVEDQFDVGNW